MRKNILLRICSTSFAKAIQFVSRPYSVGTNTKDDQQILVMPYLLLPLSPIGVYIHTVFRRSERRG